MTAHDKIAKLHERLKNRFPDLTYFDVQALRLAEKRLHRWCELECGDDNGCTSFCVVRDDETGKTFTEFHPYKGETYRVPCHDREKGALKRVREICASKGLNFFYQTDPRGCALYISKEPMADNNYSSKGTAVCD